MNTGKLLVLSLLLTFSTPAFADTSKEAIADDPIQTKLYAFGHSLIDSINATILPCHTKREIKQTADGKYIGRYITIDKKSLRASYKKPEARSKSVSYIGFLDYTEQEMHCSGKSHKEASTSKDCVTVGRNDTRELVKYVRGKWTY